MIKNMVTSLIYTMTTLKKNGESAAIGIIKDANVGFLLIAVVMVQHFSHIKLFGSDAVNGLSLTVSIYKV